MFRQQIQTARTLGISYKRFTGWEPAQYHTTQPNGTIKVITETEWDPIQQHIMLTLNDWENNICPCGCGQQMTDTLEDSQREEQHQWAAGYVVCEAGKTLIEAQEFQDQQDQDNNLTGPKPYRLWQIQKQQ